MLKVEVVNVAIENAPLAFGTSVVEASTVELSVKVMLPVGATPGGVPTLWAALTLTVSVSSWPT
jgi:hypothetical protein